MKNRKSILVVFAILVLLCLGIGYAALSDHLELNINVSGDGSTVIDDPMVDIDTPITGVDETKFDIQWGTATTGDYPHTWDHSSTATIEDVNAPAQLTITNLAVKGDELNHYAYAEFEVINASPEGYDAYVEAYLVEREVNADATVVFEFALADGSDGVEIVSGNLVKIPANQKAILRVKVYLNETLSMTESYESEYIIGLYATEYNPQDYVSDSE